MSKHSWEPRLARLNDAQNIAELSRDLIETGLGWSWTPRRVTRALRNKETCSIAVDDDDLLVGFAVMEFYDEHAHLCLMAVRNTHQRLGIGHTMINWLEVSARTAGIATIFVESRAKNIPARSFYRSLGYQDLFLIPGYYQGREAAVRLVRDLRKSVSSLS